MNNKEEYDLIASEVKNVLDNKLFENFYVEIKTNDLPHIDGYLEFSVIVKGTRKIGRKNV